jgi:hypothetical protein
MFDLRQAAKILNTVDLHIMQYSDTSCDAKKLKKQTRISLLIDMRCMSSGLPFHLSISFVNGSMLPQKGRKEEKAVHDASDSPAASWTAVSFLLTDVGEHVTP